jgi:phosphoribosylformylglycinamidine cyclo-ligase
MLFSYAAKNREERIDQMMAVLKTTWKTSYVSVRDGMYPIITKKFLLPEILHTDGIGSKGIYHWRARTFRAAALDALAMNLNDLAMVGAVPYALQNNLMLPKDDHHAIIEVLKTLARECKKRSIVMTGGETPIHEDMEGLDVSITIAGFIPKIRNNAARPGDVLVGLRSSGLHSNGFTKVRRVLGDRFIKECTTPTKIYIDDILPLLKHHDIHAMMHITGGGFAKLRGILGRDLDAHVDQPKKLSPQHIFHELFTRGVSSKEMYSTFNCGVGFVIAVPKRGSDKVVKVLPGGALLGEVVNGTGHIRISSAFDGREVSF